MFVINDVKSGNYLSPASFQMANTKDKKWLYITYTGRTTGFTSYNDKEQTELVKLRLDEIGKQIGTDKILKVVEVNTEEISKGVRIIEEI